MNKVIKVIKDMSDVQLIDKLESFHNYKYPRGWYLQKTRSELLGMFHQQLKKHIKLTKSLNNTLQDHKLSVMKTAYNFYYGEDYDQAFKNDRHLTHQKCLAIRELWVL